MTEDEIISVAYYAIGWLTALATLMGGWLMLA